MYQNRLQMAAGESCVSVGNELRRLGLQFTHNLRIVPLQVVEPQLTQKFELFLLVNILNNIPYNLLSLSLLKHPLIRQKQQHSLIRILPRDMRQSLPQKLSRHLNSCVF